MSRQSLFRLLSILLATLLGVVIVELSYRLCRFRRLTIQAGIEDPHFHHRLKPDTDYHFVTSEFDVTIRTNRYGLRGPDPVIPKPAGVTRLLVMGDSFIFGFPVKDDETFAHLLEQGLRQQGYPVEVVNGGVSGYAPTLHYVSLRDQFMAFEPNAAILWLDLGDVQEDAWFQKNLLYDHQGRIVRCDPRYINGRYDWWEWAKRNSLLAQYLDRKLVRTVFKMRILGPIGYLKTALRGERAKVAIARLKAAQQASDLAQHDRFLLVRETSTAKLIEPYWALTARYIVMMRDLLAEREVPLILGVYPYGMVAGPDQWGKGRTYWGFQAGRTYDASQALAVFHRFCDGEHIPLIDSFERFREAARSDKLFYDWDGHFTPAGQRILADYVLHDPQLKSIFEQQLAARTGSSASHSKN